MPGYASNISLDDAVAWLRDAGPDAHTLVVTHAKPDGDALGSLLALTLVLRQLGQTVTGALVPPVPAPLAELAGAEALVRCGSEAEAVAAAAGVTRVVVVDTGAWSQVGVLRPAIEPLLTETLIIDHHLSGGIDAARLLIDGEAAAAAELVAEVVGRLLGGGADARLPEAVRDGLFVGIASDPGWFRFSNTRPQTHALAGRLIAQGADHANLYRRLEQQDRPEKLRLTQRALASIEAVAGGRGVIMTLRPADFAETGALPEETDRLVDLPQNTGPVEAVVLAVEAEAPNGNGLMTRMSFRSKPPAAPGAPAVNVAELAGEFDGGGHARAAGARAAGGLDVVLPRLRVAFTRTVEALQGGAA